MRTAETEVQVLKKDAERRQYDVQRQQELLKREAAAVDARSDDISGVRLIHVSLGAGTTGGRQFAYEPTGVSDSSSAAFVLGFLLTLLRRECGGAVGLHFWGPPQTQSDLFLRQKSQQFRKKIAIDWRPEKSKEREWPFSVDEDPCP